MTGLSWNCDEMRWVAYAQAGDPWHSVARRTNTHCTQRALKPRVVPGILRERLARVFEFSPHDRMHGAGSVKPRWEK